MIDDDRLKPHMGWKRERNRGWQQLPHTEAPTRSESYNLVMMETLRVGEELECEYQVLPVGQRPREGQAYRNRMMYG